MLEKGAQFLAKVRISGGGRCNVTHACFDPREFTTRISTRPAGLLAPFQVFQASDTVAWFESRGVKLKTESDGRMFPASDSSQTIIDCLMRAARAAGVKLHDQLRRRGRHQTPGGAFELTLANGESLVCDRLLLATGGCRAARPGELAVSLGHTLEPPVPSLFTFHVEAPWVRELAGRFRASVEVSVPGTKLREQGALLLTHWGLSGPVILRLSAWGARAFCTLSTTSSRCASTGCPTSTRKHIAAELRRAAQCPTRPAHCQHADCAAARPALGTARPGRGHPARDPLGRASPAPRANTPWSSSFIRTELAVAGKSLNKDEFVTCGGVRLSEVNFKTMESRICPGLYFAGELLDIDGLTGGFNFQAAWTTGWIAGRAMAGQPSCA